jgi:peptide/nickel transport system ATP-binding protein
MLADFGYLIIILVFHISTILILILGVNALLPINKKISKKILLKYFYPSILIGFGSEFGMGTLLSSLNLSLGSYNLILFSTNWLTFIFTNFIFYRFKTNQEVAGRNINLNLILKFSYKLFLLITIVVAILAIVELIIRLFSIPIFIEFQYGLFWAMFLEVFVIVLTHLINKVLPKKRKIQTSILKQAMILSVMVSYGSWALFLTLFGLFGFLFGFYIFVGLPYYWILAVIYLIGLLFSLKLLASKAKNREESYQEFGDNQNIISSLVESNQVGIILEVKNLKTYFYTEEGIVKAVDGVSFKMHENKILGLVGETGCGKSVTALSIMRLISSPGEIEAGQVLFYGEDLLKKSEKDMLSYRGKKMTMIFQDPLNSLNPVYRVGNQLSEVYITHQKDLLLKEVRHNTKKIAKIEEKIRDLNECLKEDETIHERSMIKSKAEINEELDEKYKELGQLKALSSIYAIAESKSIDMIRAVGIPDPEQIINRYPHELSGGMRQRIMIAMGLICNPQLLLADEPTTALDVTIQAQILRLLKELQKKYQTSILLITHDLGIISEMCDEVAVMYSGKIMEYTKLDELKREPLHPYTRGLISTIPRVGKSKADFPEIPGVVPNLIYLPKGCHFHPRCDKASEICVNIPPELIEYRPGHFVACHLYNGKNNSIEEYK